MARPACEAYPPLRIGAGYTGGKDMPMHSVSRADMQAMLFQLKQAICGYEQWHESLVRTLICRLPFDPREAAPQAHRECEFGKWYYNNVPEKLRAQPGFVALERAYERMHRMAARLLLAMQAGAPIRSEDYDGFAHPLAKFRLQLDTLKRELERALGNLDPLTGAHSRIGMFTWLEEQRELVKRGVLSCGLSMIDLDLFKSINDTYGHLAGDQVLAHAAHYFMEHIRPYDRLYRYGGEELPDTDLATCHELVNRLRVGLADSPVTVAGTSIRCRVSCGVALLDPEIPVEKSVERADKAMYAAKAAGRNLTRSWEPSIG